jgi:spermidine synthase
MKTKKIYKIFSVLVIITTFLSSFLIFLIQPLIGKFLLPYFGGNSYVWIISVSFFTTMLFLSYTYVFFLTKLSLKRQLLFHFILLLFLSLLHFFIFFSKEWFSPIFPNNLESEIISVALVLNTLFISIAALFFLLAATNTLLQSWYGRLMKKKSPYFLYAISNLGAILGLFSYPLFFELLWGNLSQSMIWSFLFLLYLLLFISIIIIVKYLSGKSLVLKEKFVNSSLTKIKPSVILIWFFFSALPVMTYLVLMDSLNRGISSFPLVWILPLFSYLLSFVLPFGGLKIGILKKEIMTLSLLLLLLSMSNIFLGNYYMKVLLFNLLAFSVGLLCHSHLYEKRPREVKYLPLFYLLITLGGAIASLFISLLTPIIFNNYYEFYLVIILILVAFLILSFNSDFRNKIKKRFYLLLSLMIFVSSVAVILSLIQLSSQNTKRNFFGVLRIREYSSKNLQSDYPESYNIKSILHGSISHGQEIASYNNSGRTSYYSDVSGLGISLDYLQERNSSLDVAMIGLGAGMAAVNNREEDRMIFYEINPLMINIAKEEFSYLKTAKGEVDIREGDARLILESELSDSSERVDLLAIDAFSDDAIPAHLLSREAFELYLEKIKSDGIIAYHISNRYLNLSRILKPFCDEFSTNCVLIKNSSVSDEYINSSSWFVFSRNDDFLKYLESYNHDYVKLLFGDEIDDSGLNYWTDDKSNILPLLK